VGFFPHIDPFLFAHTSPLVQVGVAGKAQGRDPVIVRLDALPFAVSELVGVGSNYGPVADSTMLAR
jgi:hypothetical protein